MSKLPVVTHVTHETKLPILGTVKFRAFTTGEHRQLLQAISMADSNAVLNTINAIVTACTFDKIDVGNLEMFLVDKLYLDIYKKSRGEMNKVSYTCNASVQNEDGTSGVCGETTTFNIPLDDAVLFYPIDYQEKTIIKISETSGIKLRQPTLERFKKLKSDGSFTLSDEFVFAGIECVFDGDKILTPGEDFSVEELTEYLEKLPPEITDKISDFYNNTPALQISLDLKCPKCGNQTTEVLSGLDDFFG